MEAFSHINGIVFPLDRANVDTDQIIPKQYLKSIKRTGFGPNLFDDWRYLDPGEPGDDHSRRRINPEFELNHERYQGAQILLARENFGCGSSREHAPWALIDFGFRVVIAPSFADIFFNNCFKNGLLPIVQEPRIIDSLFNQAGAESGFSLHVDLPEQTITTPAGDKLTFDVDAGLKHRLVNGLDDVGLTLQHADKISGYERLRQTDAPWLFTELT